MSSNSDILETLRRFLKKKASWSELREALKRLRELEAKYPDIFREN